MSSNYDLLVAKINEFIQKFYLNKLLRGSICAAALLLALYLVLFVLVYYFSPGIPVKTFLFFFYAAIAVAVVALWVLRPALHYFKLGKNLEIEQAAALIGDHFFNVRDKLLNTIQLKALADQSPSNHQLVMAGIDQKIMELTPVPFSSAIRLNDNRKYIKYVAVPLSVIVLIFILAPAILKEGTSSFIQYDRYIAPKAPFSFELLNKKLLVSQGEDVALQLKITGDRIPQEVYVSDGINAYRLEKLNNSRFSYTFKNLQKDKRIFFSGGGFRSGMHVIAVRPRPSVASVRAVLHYPAYLKKNGETIDNAGDLVLPEGTQVRWQIHTENSSGVTFRLEGKTHPLPLEGNISSFTATLKKNAVYQILPGNNFMQSKDSPAHQISIVKDAFPTISLKESEDSVRTRILYFSGHVSDDHGLSSLKFSYQIKTGEKLNRSVVKTLPLKTDRLENPFFFMWDLSEADLEPGQALEYFFEVADNDGVNGPKTTRSEIRIYQSPTSREIATQMNEGSTALKQQMEKAIKLAAAVEKESKKLGETLLDKKQLTFDDKKQIGQLLEKQKQLEDAVKEIRKLNEKNTLQKEENKVLKEEMLEKQRQIDDLFNNVLDEKTKELLEKLQDLMEQNNKDQAQNELSKMQMDNKALKNELDRILELYKQLEFEQNLKNNIDQLKGLAQKQKEQAQKSVQEQTDTQSLKSGQKQLSQQFEELKKSLEQLEEKNSQLERPNPFKNPEKGTEQIRQQQRQSEEHLEKGQKKQASENQQKASEQMQQMAAQMEEMQQQSSETENKVNATELRQLLENLLNTSFDQEKLMLNLKDINSSDPLYTTSVQKQRNIKDNMKTIADSLFSLSKRVPQIETAVNEEMQKINFNIDKSIENLGERQTGMAGRNQQYTLTSINNLSLMLNEVLDQLQKSMKNAKGGGSGGKTSMSELQKMQQQLGDNMQKAREALQKSGNKGSVPKGQMSQEFARMAQQQQMIREALQKINREENKDGKGKLGNLNQVIQDMKDNENDLVNKKLEQKTLERQKDLLLKLLDADNAQREQEQDARRESKMARDFPPSYQQKLDAFKKLQQTQTEWIQKLPPGMNDYYKNKVSEYFKLLNSAP